MKQSPFIPAEKIKHKLLASNVVPWNSVMLRRDCLHKIPEIVGSMRGAYDWFFWVHAALAGCRFHQIDRILGCIQKSPDSVQFEIERMSTGALKCIEYYGKHLNLKDRLLYGYPHVYGFRLIRHGIICLENNRIRTGRLLFCRGLFFFLFSFRDRKSFAVAILIWLTAHLSDPRTARRRVENLFGRYLFRNQYEIVRFEQAK